MATSNFDIETLRPWIEMQASRSPGPGGQNVNKVNTRVTLLFDFEACPQLSDPQKTRIRSRLRTRLSRDGRLRIVRHRERTQARNRRASAEQLLELLCGALRPRKTRRATGPTRRSIQRRLAGKRRRGELKKQRQSATDEA